MLCDVLVEAEPEPVILMSEYWFDAVARRTVPVPLVELPTPRRMTPLALMVIVLAQGYSPADNRTAPRKPFVSIGSAWTVLMALWMFAVLSPATGEMVTLTGTRFVVGNGI